MKTSAVKGLFAAAAAVVLAATPLVGRSVTINVTKFQQRYPWNGLVDIDYTITRDEGESELDPSQYSVEISVVNCDVTPAVTNVAHVFRQGALPVSDGAHRVTWDANAEGVNFKSQNVKVFAEIVYYAEKYMIIDVSGGSDADYWPVTYMNGKPDGGFNTDEYRGGKIALRLIPPGSFIMGSPTTESGRRDPQGRAVYDRSASEVQHAVGISRPFYIGVFEITQKQYEYVMGTNPSQRKNSRYPVERVNYNDIRGTADTNTHQCDWPWTNEVAATSFMGRIRAKCKEQDSSTGAWDVPVAGLFDLPTDAQWEYACRAGTKSAYNNGSDDEAAMNSLGSYVGNHSSSEVAVGSYNPNAWGLYDMHGNVAEWCLDWYQENVQDIENSALDPVGPPDGVTDGSCRVVRNGCFCDKARYCRSAGRTCRDPASTEGAFDVVGFRLSRTLSNVRNDACVLGAGQAGDGAVDLREGVLVVRRTKELMPFAWSSTNFTGNVLVKDTGFVTIDPASKASVRVVQVTGDGADVSQWTTEVAGTAKTLVSEQQGEGEVKWDGVKRGVWKAEFVIQKQGGEAYRETRILDLRNYGMGFAMLVF